MERYRFDAALDSTGALGTITMTVDDAENPTDVSVAIDVPGVARPWQTLTVTKPGTSGAPAPRAGLPTRRIMNMTTVAADPGKIKARWVLVATQPNQPDEVVGILVEPANPGDEPTKAYLHLDRIRSATTLVSRPPYIGGEEVGLAGTRSHWRVGDFTGGWEFGFDGLRLDLTPTGVGSDGLAVYGAADTGGLGPVEVWRWSASSSRFAQTIQMARSTQAIPPFFPTNSNYSYYPSRSLDPFPGGTTIEYTHKIKLVSTGQVVGYFYGINGKTSWYSSSVIPMAGGYKLDPDVPRKLEYAGGTYSVTLPTGVSWYAAVNIPRL